jgi:hypothetical protein
VTPRAALFPAIELEPFAPDGYAMLNALFPPKHERDEKTNPSIVQVYWNHLCRGVYKSSATVHGNCMRVLGELAHHFPREVGTEDIYEKGPLYDRCLNTLKAGTSSTWMLSGALAGFDGLLQAARRAPQTPQTLSGATPNPPPLSRRPLATTEPRSSCSWLSPRRRSSRRSGTKLSIACGAARPRGPRAAAAFAVAACRVRTSLTWRHQELRGRSCPCEPLRGLRPGAAPDPPARLVRAGT